MAIDRNRVTEADILAALTGPLWCMPLTSSETDYLVHPDTDKYPGKPWVTGAVSFDADIETSDVVLEFWNGLEFEFPAGSFVPQVMYPLHVVRVVTAINIIGWFGASLRKLQSPQSLQLLATLEE